MGQIKAPILHILHLMGLQGQGNQKQSGLILILYPRQQEFHNLIKLSQRFTAEAIRILHGKVIMFSVVYFAEFFLASFFILSVIVIPLLRIFSLRRLAVVFM